MLKKQLILGLLTLLLIFMLYYLFNRVDRYSLPNLRSLFTPNHQILSSTLPLELKWEFQTNKMIEETIFGEDGTVYVKTKNTLYALNPEDGQIKWEHSIQRKNRGLTLPYENLIFITANNDTVLQALNTSDGSLVWQIPIGNFSQAQSYSDLPTIVYLSVDDKRLYIGLNLRRGNQVLAFELETWDFLWKSNPRSGVPYTMSIDQTAMLVDAKELIWLDKETGETIRVEKSSPESYRPPLYSNEMIYASGEFLRAIKLKTLQKKWRFAHGCSSDWWDSRIPHPPLIVNGVAYIVATCDLAYAVDADTGHLLWRYQTDNQKGINSFTVFQNLGYLITEDATLYALDLDTGEVIGQMETSPQTMPLASYQHLNSNDKLLLLHYADYQLLALAPSEIIP